MADIPEDVKKLAREALAAEHDGDPSLPYLAQRIRGGLCDSHHALSAICNAIMAERDRLTRQDPETIRQAALEEALRHLHDHFPGAAAEFEAVFDRALKEAGHG